MLTYPMNQREDKPKYYYLYSAIKEDILSGNLKKNIVMLPKHFDIEILYPSKEELKNIEYRSKIEIEGQVRIVRFPGYDVCACCAPHVTMTGEIGVIKILSFIPYKKGTRIEMICGALALNDYQTLHLANKSVMNMLSAKRFEIAEAVISAKGTVTIKDEEIPKIILHDAKPLVPDEEYKEEVKKAPAKSTNPTLYLKVPSLESEEFNRISAFLSF